MKQFIEIGGECLVLNPEATAQQIADRIFRVLEKTTIAGGVGAVQIRWHVELQGPDSLVELMEAAAIEAENRRVEMGLRGRK